MRGSCETRFFSDTLRRKVDSKSGGDSAGLFLVHKLPLGNAISRSSAAWCALGVPRRLLGRPAKATRELRGEAVLKQQLGDERPNEEEMAVDGLAAILAFFGVDPKKVPHVCSALSPSGRPAEHLSPAALPQGERGEGLTNKAGTHDSGCRTPDAGDRRTFFGWTPKKAPFFSAPKKPKKSLERTRC